MTIYDIAKASGVSIATVSRVLNGSTKVRKQTREKILAVMKEQKYTPNPFARGLGLDSMKMVGILCTDVSDAFYSKAVSLVENGLKPKGINVILGCTGNDIKDIEMYLNLMLKQHVDAILLIGSPYCIDSSNDYLRAIAEKVSIVTINSLIEMDNVYCVLCDEINGIKECTKDLIAQNHTKILYLYDKLTYSGQHKMQGYEEALAINGIPSSSHLTVNTDKNCESARETVRKLLDTNCNFTAIIASEDILAIGAQKALADKGLSMPVIGCNNSVLAECATPSISSLDNRLDVLCPAAVEIVSKIVLGGDTSTIPSTTIFPAILVERESFQTK